MTVSQWLVCHWTPPWSLSWTQAPAVNDLQLPCLTDLSLPDLLCIFYMKGTLLFDRWSGGSSGKLLRGRRCCEPTCPLLRTRELRSPGSSQPFASFDAPLCDARWLWVGQPVNLVEAAGHALLRETRSAFCCHTPGEGKRGQ